MRQTLSRGAFAAAAVTSVLSLCGSPALADSVAGGSTDTSPGVLSGNTVQVPLDIPVNVCGNTVNVVALLNPAFGNSCDSPPDAVSQATPQIPRQTGSGSSAQTPDSQQQTPAPSVVGRAPAPGQPASAPGRPASVPRQPASAPGRPASVPRQPASAERQRADVTTQVRHNPAAPERRYDAVPDDTVPASAEARTLPTLAETGSEATLAASGVSALLIAGGVILYRRGRALQRR